MKAVLLGVLLSASSCCAVIAGPGVTGFILPPFYVAILGGGGGGGANNTVPIGTQCLATSATGAGTCVVAGSCLAPNEVIGNCGEFGPPNADFQCCQTVITSGTVTGPAPVVIVPTSVDARRKKREATSGPMRSTVNLIVSPNVCQLKFDLKTFELPVPNKKTGECDYRNQMSFITPQKPGGLFGPGSNSICGQNSGQHFYVPVSQGETVQVLTNLQGYGNAPPQARNIANYDYDYRIVVSFIGCGDVNEAPAGCLQYFPESHNRISSFNFDGYSPISCNQDYAICIRPKVEMATGLTFRAETFAMPTTDECVDGETIVCNKGVCCSQTPNSAYLAYTGYQKNKNKQNLRRYWCGKNLGPENLMSGTEYDVRVVSQCGWKCKYDPVGFNIDYKVDVGV